MMRILHDDWSIVLGENTSDQTLKHLATVLSLSFQMTLVQHVVLGFSEVISPSCI